MWLATPSAKGLKMQTNIDDARRKQKIESLERKLKNPYVTKDSWVYYNTLWEIKELRNASSKTK